MAEAELITFKNLDKLRKIHNMSVDQLMSELDHDRTTYYQWQKRKAIPSDDVIKLHKLFNVSTDLLLDVKPLVIES